MNDELLQELIETMKLQTTTMQDLKAICDMLKDRVEALEEKVNK